MKVIILKHSPRTRNQTKRFTAIRQGVVFEEATSNYTKHDVLEKINKATELLETHNET